jgi:hypothetical protein
MSTKNYLELRKTRDFGEKISATVQFIQQNFVAICKNLLIIGSPLIVLGLVLSILIGQRVADIWDTSFMASSVADRGVAMFTAIVVGGIYLMVIFNTIIAISYSMVAMYLENPADIQDTRKVFEMTKRIFWQVTAVSFILFIVLVVLYILFMFVFAGTMAVIGFADSASIVLIILLFFIGLLLFTYATFALSFSHLVVIVEGKTIFSSFIRSFQLIQGNWWSTFAFLFVVNMLVSVLFYAFLLPSWIFSFLINIATLDKPENYGVFMALFSALSLLGGALVLAVYCIALAIQYFHLVELKENIGLHNKIFSIGTSQNDVTEEW